MAFLNRLRRLSITIAPVGALAVAMMAAPSSASAGIMIGVESNAQLVNSTVTNEAQRATLIRMRNQGSQVIRANFGWDEIAVNCAGQTPGQLANHMNGCYNWRLVDNFAKVTNELGLKGLISITRNPQWVLGSDNIHYMGATNAQFNTLVTHYVALHRAAGTRYKRGSAYGTIPYWTIHNESNSPTFWAPRPNPARYGLLYARTAVALKTAHPTAKIAAGPSNPTGNSPDGSGIRPVVFVPQAVAAINRNLPGSLANKKRYINAWAHNPYPDMTKQPSTPPRVFSPMTIGMTTVDRLFPLLDRNPLTRGTKVWATEFGYNTKGFSSTTEPRQAQFIAEAFDWLESKRRIEIGIYYGLNDEATGFWTSGTYRSNGTPKPSLKMMQRMISIPKAGLANRVRRGTTVRVWGRSNIAPRTGVLAYKVGSGPWREMPRQKRAADGSIVASIRLQSPVVTFATYDKGNAAAGVRKGYGPFKTVRTV